MAGHCHGIQSRKGPLIVVASYRIAPALSRPRTPSVPLDYFFILGAKSYKKGITGPALLCMAGLQKYRSANSGE